MIERGAAPGAARTSGEIPSYRGAECGSVTPLMIGMVVCLLLLGAGVAAATSAFLARQRLQNACDGAAAAAADAAESGYYALPGSGGNDGGNDGGDAVTAAARDYLQARSPKVAAIASISTGSVVLTCSTESPIAMGGLFGVPTLPQTVQAVGRAVL